LAAFGLPPLHHEDDPYRGLMAAFDIRKELQSIGHDARIGIATGNAFCGPVGSATRSEYTMHGVNVNLAARLMVRADSILCDEATREATGDSFSFAEQPSFKIKGRETPVRIFEPELTG
ncbi:MAG: adenylate/guanylate cyclase domain-containing protein, partial [Leptospiraceae bacterium]|nr:adenylate/guanylate cyclase domain-containing protein [Leptospiraceae bacterium]